MKKAIKIVSILVGVIILIKITTVVYEYGSIKLNYYHLNVLFDEIGSLQKGDPVKFNGMKCGKVYEYKFKGSKLNVVILIKKDIKIPENSSFSIASIGLMGERLISIAGSDSKSYYDETSEIFGTLDESQSTFFSVFDKIDSIYILLKEQNKLLKDMANQRSN